MTTIPRDPVPRDKSIYGVIMEAIEAGKASPAVCNMIARGLPEVPSVFRKPLYFACSRHSPQIADALIAAGAVVNEISRCQEFCLGGVYGQTIFR